MFQKMSVTLFGVNGAKRYTEWLHQFAVVLDASLRKLDYKFIMPLF